MALSGGDGADDDLDDHNEATLADDEVQLFDDGIFEEDAVSGEAQQEESSDGALASSPPISITAAPHQGLQLGVQGFHRRRHSGTPAGFLRGKAAHALWVPGGKVSPFHDLRLTCRMFQPCTWKVCAQCAHRFAEATECKDATWENSWLGWRLAVTRLPYTQGHAHGISPPLWATFGCATVLEGSACRWRCG